METVCVICGLEMSASSWTDAAREKHVAQCCEYRFSLSSSCTPIHTTSALSTPKISSCISNACESVADLGKVLSAGSLESVRFCSTCGRDLSGHYWSDRRRLQHLQSCLGIGRRRRRAKIDPPDPKTSESSTVSKSAPDTCSKPVDPASASDSTKKPSKPRKRATKLTKQLKQQERLLAVERVFGRPLPPDEECESLAFRASELISSQASASTSTLELLLDSEAERAFETLGAQAHPYCTCDSPSADAASSDKMRVRLYALASDSEARSLQQRSLWTLSALADALPFRAEKMMPKPLAIENDSNTTSQMSLVDSEFHSQFLVQRLFN